MLGRQQNSGSSQPSFSLRAKIEGVKADVGDKLPSLDDVYNDAKKLADIQTQGIPVPKRAILTSQKTGQPVVYGPDPGNDSTLPEPLAWNISLPHLFKFAYFCQTYDVPTDLLEPVIWALEMFNRVLTELTDEQLYDVGHYLKHQEPVFTGRFMRRNILVKLSHHLLDPNIDRPSQAVPHLKTVNAIEIDMVREGQLSVKRPDGTSSKPSITKPWLNNLNSYALYADARTNAGLFDEDTKQALERVVEACNAGGFSGALTSSCLIRARINFAQVLKRMGEPEDEWQKHAQWAARFLRKNPKLLPPGVLVQMLGRAAVGEPPHPVLDILGGEKWLKPHIAVVMATTRPLATHLRHEHTGLNMFLAPDSQTRKNLNRDSRGSRPPKRATLKQEERIVAMCRQCGARESMKKLFRCSGCQHMYYCSKECQRMNWKMHKDSCRDRAAELKQISELECSGSLEAQRKRDWMRWRGLPHEGSSHALINALGLHRDPSRGRTHIVLRNLRYTPTTPSGKEKDLRDRFEVVAAGVFKIADILCDIEGLMGLDEGEGCEYVAGLLDDLDSLGVTDKNESVPILDLSFGTGFGEDLRAWLGSNKTTKSALRLFEYDPNWRMQFNKDGPPAELLRLVSGVPDAEHDL